MKIIRRNTRTIKIGNVVIGGNNPIAIQSMAKTKTADIEKTVRQIKELEGVGCEIVRLAVRDGQDAKALRKIKGRVRLPIVADIHFNWRLAIEAIDSGIDKIRLNPGNIYKQDQIREIAKAAKLAHIPIRVGVNSGSLRSRQSSVVSRQLRADRMIKSALDYIKILEKFGFSDIVVSLKASNILDTVEAYRKISVLCDYPLHLGVTATGFPFRGTIKSSIAIGSLLLEGIGDTIRISLTDKPAQEVRVAKIILESLALRHSDPEIISCPTCGRCEVDLVKIVKELENKLSVVPAINIGGSAKYFGGSCQLSDRPLKVAVMGCAVNGPGEAAEADIGVAFGKKEGLLFKKGKAIKKIPYYHCTDVLLKEIRHPIRRKLRMS